MSTSVFQPTVSPLTLRGKQAAETRDHGVRLARPAAHLCLASTHRAGVTAQPTQAFVAVCVPGPTPPVCLLSSKWDFQSLSETLHCCACFLTLPFLSRTPGHLTSCSAFPDSLGSCICALSQTAQGRHLRKMGTKWGSGRGSVRMQGGRSVCFFLFTHKFLIHYFICFVLRPVSLCSLG